MLIAVGVDDNPEAFDAMVLATTVARVTAAEVILATVYPDLPGTSPTEDWPGWRARPKRCFGS